MNYNTCLETVNKITASRKWDISDIEDVISTVFSILKSCAIDTVGSCSGRQIQMMYRLASQRLRFLKEVVLPSNFSGTKLRSAKRVASEGLRVLRRYKGRMWALRTSDLLKIQRRLERVAGWSGA